MNTEIHLARGRLRDTQWLQSLCKSVASRTVVVSDPAVLNLSARLAHALSARLIELPQGGEKIKTRETKEWIEDELLQNGYAKDTLLLAVGGGVTTDLVGFVAATYCRGIPLILIPTTLLGMVDAAIGAKTAVNTVHGKNMIGALYAPNAVVIDPEMLDTLSEAQHMHGTAEMLKIALTSDRALLHQIQTRAPLDTLIANAIAAKREVLAHDPLEQGLRRVLNFGHTVGHALECVSDYAMAHGEAVLLGCIAESALSCMRGMLPESELAEILGVYEALPIQLRLPARYSRDKLFSAMTYDKKNANGAIRCVLLERIGTAASFNGAYCTVVSTEELTAVASWMEARYG